MHQAITAARDWLAAIHPASPWALLTLGIWLAVYAVRRYLPGAWVRLEALAVAGSPASKLLQGLPSVLAGALVGAAASGDYSGAWKGALAGALSPAWHHFLKASPLPYGNGVKPPVGPLVALLALGSALVAGHACATPAPLHRTAAPSCDAGSCPVPDASDERSAGSVPSDPPDALPPPQFGALLVVLKTAEGVEHAILCGGEVSSDMGGPAPAACPYDHDGGRTLLKLDRDGGQ